jgi:hypothetical protein
MMSGINNRAAADGIDRWAVFYFKRESIGRDDIFKGYAYETHPAKFQEGYNNLIGI